jgi:lysozyme family protein
MDLLQANTDRWSKCKVNPSKQSQFNAVAARLTASKARYQAVEAKTGVPWWFIAVVHEREASQSWKANIAQGDPWNKVSTHVPRGRGPFTSWEDAAYDALVNCAPYAARNKDWSIGNALTMLEKYNGLGYAKRGIPSPYIWAGSNQYVSGKYVSDGVFSPTAVDTQLGCAGLLMSMGISKTSVPTVPLKNASAGGVIIAGTATMASTPHHYWPWIIAGTLVFAAAVWAIIHFTERK